MESVFTGPRGEGQDARETRSVPSCIECDTPLELDEVEQGDLVSCPECGLEMQLVSTDPSTLDLVREEPEVVHEDWSET